MLAPLVAELQHCAFDFAPDLKTLGVRCFSCKDTGFHGTVYEVCTLLAADFNKGCLTGLVADNTPVPAGEVCLAGDLHLTAAAVGPAAVAGFFEFVNGDTFVAAFVLDDELALVDLFLVDRVRVNPEFIGNHLAGKDRADRTTAVDTDHDDIVKVDLLALGKFIECHCIATLDRDTDLLDLCTVKVFLDQFREQERSAVEGTGSLGQILGISDEHGLGIVEISTFPDSKDRINCLCFKCVFPECGHRTAEFSLLLDICVVGPCVEHIAFLCHVTSPPRSSLSAQHRP